MWLILTTSTNIRKTDFGFDLGDQLAKQAVGELAREIDTEVTNMLIDAADEDASLVWSKTLPVGVSKTEHYEGFMEIFSAASQIIYDRTQKFAANYVLCASDVPNVLRFMRGFVPAPAGDRNGPYFAGTVSGVKVYVLPQMSKGEFVFGLNGGDMLSSAGVFAPYMAIVPTQLLGYADGGMSQGFSTLYDCKILNKLLLVKGKITD